MVLLKSLLLGIAALSTSVVAAPAAAPSPDDPEGGGSVIIFPLPSTRPSAPFGGIGQIRTRSREGPDYEDLGCLTKDGRWTVNEALCGVFKADRDRPEGYGIDIWKLKSRVGACQMWATRFKCEKGAEPTEFGVSTYLPTYRIELDLCRPSRALFICKIFQEIVADGRCLAISFQPWVGLPGGIPGVEVLRWGQYGLMAGYVRNPPSPTDEPQEIHLVSYSEPGKYVWLTWSPLVDKTW